MKKPEIKINDFKKIYLLKDKEDFQISIKEHLYTGFLRISGITNLPRRFKVVVEEKIIGNLFINQAGNWQFIQNENSNILISELSHYQCKSIAKQLGEVVENSWPADLIFSHA